MILALGRPRPFLGEFSFYANLNFPKVLIETTKQISYLEFHQMKENSQNIVIKTIYFAHFMNTLFFHSFSRLFPFKAYRKWVAKNGEEPELPGLDLSHNQLFFLNYAQIWCGSMRPEDALTKIRSSVHSPGPIRVLGPLSNSR